MTRLLVIGQGYVGLPLAIAAARRGLAVVGFDTDVALVSRLNDGYSHIGDVSNASVQSAIASGYHATADAAEIADADAVVVCVPTPLRDGGGPDLRYVFAAGEDIARHVSPGTIVVLESTSYPGTTEDVFAPLVLASGLELDEDVWIAFSPERVDPSNMRFGVENTPKLVGGVTAASTVVAAELYEQFIDEVIRCKGTKEVELAKLIENTFRHVNIALVNEMARFSRELDIDIWAAIEYAATKPFGYMPFYPGPGVGGHCIPIDPNYLGHHVRASLGYPFRMVEVAEEINRWAPFYVADRLRDELNRLRLSVRGSEVLLVGVAYKADVSDTRESPAAQIAAKLSEWGASVRFHDPYVAEWSWDGVTTGHSVPDGVAAARASDAVILLQAHSCLDLDALAGACDLFLDTRGVASLDLPSVVRL